MLRFLLVEKNSELQEGTPGFPGKGNGNPLQYSNLENPLDRGAWQATVHGVARVGNDLATKSPLLVRSKILHICNL